MKSEHIHIHISGVKSTIFEAAAGDLLDGCYFYRVWLFLAWQDIRQRYRRSILGPLWLTISTGVMIAVMSILYGRLFKLPLDTYAPFLASSLVTWTLMLSLINEGCLAFMAADQLIKQVRMPLTVHAWRVVWRNIIVFIHNVVILLPVWIIFDTKISAVDIASVFIALITFAINGLWIGIIFGALCARFRDISLIVGNLMQVIFFVTPVMWLPAILEGKGVAKWLVSWNPFYHFLEIMRTPLMGGGVPVESWGIVITITLTGLLIGGVVLGKIRKRLVYWL
jgi:ABC-type polysaccharide/polyol phosphate export permease